MRSFVRLLIAVLVTLVGVVPLAVSYTLATAVQLLATTVFILGGTGHPLVVDGETLETPYARDYGTTLLNNYIVPSGVVREDPTDPDDYNLVAVYSPEEFFPVSGSMTFDDSVEAGQKNLNACVSGGPDRCVSAPITVVTDSTDPNRILIVGYSQSAVIASLVKRDLIAGTTSVPGDEPVSFILLANPMRPNGGILARVEDVTIPLIGITFHGAAPTNSGCTDSGTGPCYETVDVAQQYDLLGGDAPADLLNVLAWANSLAAYVYLHGAVPAATLDPDAPLNLDQAEYQGETGDTTYYLIPAERLPLLMPLEQLGVPKPILAVVDAPLRVLIEASYVRNVSPGEQVTFTLLPAADPITVGVNFVKAIPVGIDDGVEMVTGERPLDTVAPDHYGVGGDDESSVFDGVPLNPEPPLEKMRVLSGTELPEGDAEGLGPALQDDTLDAEDTLDAVRRGPGPLGQLVRSRNEFDGPNGRTWERAANGRTWERADARTDEAEDEGEGEDQDEGEDEDEGEGEDD